MLKVTIAEKWKFSSKVKVLQNYTKVQKRLNVHFFSLVSFYSLSFSPILPRSRAVKVPAFTTTSDQWGFRPRHNLRILLQFCHSVFRTCYGTTFHLEGAQRVSINHLLTWLAHHQCPDSHKGSLLDGVQSFKSFFIDKCWFSIDLSFLNWKLRAKAQSGTDWANHVVPSFQCLINETLLHPIQIQFHQNQCLWVLPVSSSEILLHITSTHIIVPHSFTITTFTWV